MMMKYGRTKCIYKEMIKKMNDDEIGEKPR